MGGGRSLAPVVVGAVVCVLLQVVLAPNIALASAMPNFLAAYVLALAVAQPDRAEPVLAFVLGLAFDLLGGGPVGAMAFLLVLMAFLASRAFSFLDNDTLFMPLAILLASLILVEVFYALFLLGTGLSASFGDAFLYRALPCALYDCVAALVMFPIISRFMAPSESQQPDGLHLR